MEVWTLSFQAVREKGGDMSFRSGFPTFSVALILLVALNLGSAYANHDEFVFKQNRLTPFERLSVSTSEEEGSGDSGTHCTGVSGIGSVLEQTPSVSDDGRYVAFTSSASNLSSEDLNGGLLTDIFVRDRKKGITELASVGPTGLGVPKLPSIAESECLDWSFNPSISGNGRFVAFASYGLQSEDITVDALTGLPTNLKVYLRDLKKGRTVLISARRSESGGPVSGNAGDDHIGVSDNGERIVFVASVRPLSGVLDSTGCDDSSECHRQIYLRDLSVEGPPSLVSVSSDGEPANQDAVSPSISDDGRVVVFDSYATNLVPEIDSNGACLGVALVGPTCSDVFAHDLESGETELVSVSKDGGSTADGSSETETYRTNGQVVSADGRFVLFTSTANNLVPDAGPFNSGGTLLRYVRDRETKRTERVSVTSTGRVVTGGQATISDNGRYVFMNTGNCHADVCNLTGQNGHPRFGAFAMHDRKTGQMDVLRMRWDERDLDRYDDEGDLLWSSTSGDGHTVAWASSNTGYAERDANQSQDIFLATLGIRDLGGFGIGRKSGQAPETPGKEVCIADDVCLPPLAVVSSEDSETEGVDLSSSGADLLQASVVYRPGLSDLFTRIELESMPRVLPTLSPVFYGLAFDAGDKSYEVRATSLLGGTFGLFDCTSYSSTCTKVGHLRGGYGTTGERVVFSLPLEEIGLQDGGELSDVAAFSALGNFHTGAAKILDRVWLEK
ncbi:MAG: hypothetical protein ACRDLB_04610 [Actinomycetota bacterium]